MWYVCGVCVCVWYKTHGIELVDMVKGNDDRQIKYFVANRQQIK